MAGDLNLKLKIKALVEGAKSVLGLNKSVDDLSKKTDKTSRSMKGLNKDLDKNESKTKKAAKGAGAMGKAMRGLGAALAGAFFVKANKNLESLNAGFEVVTGSTEAAAAEMEYVKDVAQRMGLSVAQSADAYLSLAAASKGTAVEGETSRKIFEAVSLAMGKLGKSSADTEGALLAVEQMISKGKVSAEELRGQLGERLPGAFQAAANAMGVTTAELDKMLQSGSVVAEDLLPGLADELTKLYDDGKQIDTLSANWNRLMNAITGTATETGKTSGAIVGMNEALKVAVSVVKFLNLGLQSAIQYIKAAGAAWGEFEKLITFNQTWADFKQNVDDAFGAATLRIAESADAIYGLNTSLEKAGQQAKKTGADMEAAAKAGEKSAEAMKGQADAAVILAQQLKAIDELQKAGIITDQQAITNKAELNAAYEKQAGAIKKTSDEYTHIADQMIAQIEAAKTQKEVTELTARAQELLAGNVQELGRAMTASAAATGAFVAAQGKAKLAAIGTSQSLDQLARDLVEINNLQKAGSITSKEAATATAKTKGAMSDLGTATEKTTQATKDHTQASKEQSEQVISGLTPFGKLLETTGAIRQSMNNLSEAAGRTFDALLDSIRKTRGVWQNFNGVQAIGVDKARQYSEKIAGLNAELREMRELHRSAASGLTKFQALAEAAGLAIEISFLKQKAAAERLVDKLKRVGTVTKEMASRMLGSVQTMGLLDSANLDGLRSQINAARDATIALEDAAKSTLQTLQDELSRYNNDLLSIERRRYEAQAADIKAKLQEAIDAGNAEATADLRAALATLDKVYAVRKKEAEDRIKELEASAQTGTTSQRATSNTGGDSEPAATNRTVTVHLKDANGNDTSVMMGSDQDAEAFLKALENAGYTAT